MAFLPLAESKGLAAKDVAFQYFFAKNAAGSNYHIGYYSNIVKGMIMREEQTYR